MIHYVCKVHVCVILYVYKVRVCVIHCVYKVHVCVIHYVYKVHVYVIHYVYKLHLCVILYVCKVHVCARVEMEGRGEGGGGTSKSSEHELFEKCQRLATTPYQLITTILVYMEGGEEERLPVTLLSPSYQLITVI